MITPIRWEADRLLLLDQTLLPVEERVREYTRWRDVAESIRSLVVRGAPAIGCAAAFGVALAARESRARDGQTLLADLEEAFKGLAATRATAANLFWALDRMRAVASAHQALPVPALQLRLLGVAQAIFDEVLAVNRACPSLWRGLSLQSTRPLPRAPPCPSRSGRRARPAARPAARRRRPRARSTIPPST